LAENGLAVAADHERPIRAGYEFPGGKGLDLRTQRGERGASIVKAQAVRLGAFDEIFVGDGAVGHLTIHLQTEMDVIPIEPAIRPWHGNLLQRLRLGKSSISTMFTEGAIASGKSGDTCSVPAIGA
jgi:hypothetical protein